MSDVIYLSNVRLSFPHLIEPQKQVNETTGVTRISYNAEFIMPVNHPGYIQFMQLYQKMALAKWVEHVSTVMHMIQADRKLRCYGAGEEKVNKKTFKPYDGYPGHVYITSGSDRQPQVMRADGNPVDPANTMAIQQEMRKMYGGCFVNAAVKPWLQSNKHGNGIRCDLVAVQFNADGEAFGEGAADVTGIFGAVAQAPATPGFMAPQAPAMPAAPFGNGLPPFMMGQ